jgi:hypothetical protein
MPLGGLLHFWRCLVALLTVPGTDRRATPQRDMDDTQLERRLTRTTTAPAIRLSTAALELDAKASDLVANLTEDRCQLASARQASGPSSSSSSSSSPVTARRA